MDTDRNGMVVLSREECLRRLGGHGIGRLAATVGALPAIFPVSYATSDGDVYFRTAPGTKLAAAARHAVVAFEVDEFDPAARTGWSVQVVGPARPVEDAGELDRLARLPLARWVAGGPDVLVRIRSQLVSGREIRRATPRLPDGHGRPLPDCPACGSDVLEAVSDGELANFVCTHCFACWHTELGSTYRIPAATCSGCRLAGECRGAGAG